MCFFLNSQIGGAFSTIGSTASSTAVHLTEHWEDNEAQYKASVGAYLFNCAKDQRLSLLTTHSTFPAFVAFSFGE